MPTDQTRSVSLTAELNAFILAQVASGRYQNRSALVRAGLRRLMQQARRSELPGPSEVQTASKTRAVPRERHARRV
jgi:putative addiction module CopG family antidote